MLLKKGQMSEAFEPLIKPVLIIAVIIILIYITTKVLGLLK